MSKFKVSPDTIAKLKELRSDLSRVWSDRSKDIAEFNDEKYNTWERIESHQVEIDKHETAIRQLGARVVSKINEKLSTLLPESDEFKCLQEMKCAWEMDVAEFCVPQIDEPEDIDDPSLKFTAVPYTVETETERVLEERIEELTDQLGKIRAERKV